MQSIPKIYDKRPEDGVIRSALRSAVEKTLDQDYDLIALGGHEQAIAHRIAFYLEPHFTGYHTDCEYNRQKHLGKSVYPESPRCKKKMRPDIIVHRRNEGLLNVLAVEMKANANPASKDDLAKLRSLKGERFYLYKAAAFVTICNVMDEMEDGILRATIGWYLVESDKAVEQVKLRANLQCDKHVAEVKDILTQRKKREPRRRK